MIDSPNSSDKPCRLLYLVGQLGLGGLELQLFYLLQAIDRQRYKPMVVVWNYREQDPYVPEIRALGVPVLPLENHRPRSEKLMAFRRLVFQFRPEVVHSYCFFTNWAAWWGTVGSAALAIGSIRNNFTVDRQDAGLVLGRICARWPRIQICNSSAAKQRAQSCFTPFKPKIMHVVRNGLALTRFIPKLYPRNACLLAVGNLYARKRWDRLVRIVSLLSARGAQFHVRHVGDGPLRGELEGLAKHLGVNHLVQFLGPRKDIPELLADSDFLVHTADDEGCPNVVMEAMACGRAVVAMDAGDIPLLIEDEKTGFVVRRGDEARFSDRVIELLSSHDMCVRMGAAGRAKAEREFRLERLVSETLSVYKAAGWRDA
jgi:glycosyltransferase involved in cell wall biosynthesis